MPLEFDTPKVETTITPAPAAEKPAPTVDAPKLEK